MKAVICDRCGRPLPPSNHYTSGDIARITIGFILSDFMPMPKGCKIIETQQKDLDICPDCSKELKKILRENNLTF